MIEFRVAVSDDWMDFAACKGEPAEIFFPDYDDHEAILEAKQVCQSCFVQEPCLDMGMKLKHGIWGGLTAEERLMLRSL